MFNCEGKRSTPDMMLTVLTCVYPQVDFEMMGGAEGLPAVGAVLRGRSDAPLPDLGWRRLQAHRCLRQVFPSIWSKHGDSTGRGGWMDVVLRATSNQPSSHHITFYCVFVCRSYVIVPPLPRWTSKQHKRIKQAHEPSFFPSLTERWRFINFSGSLETPRLWDATLL